MGRKWGYILCCLFLLMMGTACSTQSESILTEENSASKSSVSETSKTQVSSQSLSSQVQQNQNLDELYYKYFKDVADSAITSQSWDNASQIRPEFLVEFFGSRTQLSWLSTDAEPTTVPKELVESFVQLYFDIDAAYMRQSKFYNKETNAYDLSIPPSGAASYKVIDAVMKDNILTISYEYYSPADDALVIREGKLNIEIMAPTRFKYISCETTVFSE